MFTLRHVEINLPEEFAEATQGNDKKVAAAIGYLVMWAIHSEGRYAGRCSIFGDKDGCLSATYRNKMGEATYSIFAHYGEDGNYSFHS